MNFIKVFKFTIFYALVVLVFTNKLSAQQLFTSQDSLYFVGIQNDTTKLRQLTNNFGSLLAIKAHHRLGFLKYKDRDYKNAKKEYRILRQFHKATKEGKEASYFLGRIESFDDKIEKAKQHYEDYLQEDPNGYWKEGACYYLILQYLHLKDNRALPKMREFLDSFSHDSTYANHVQYRIVQHYLWNNDLENAVFEGRKLVEEYPNSSYSDDISYQIGDWLNRINRKELAKEHYRKIANQSTPNTEKAAIGQFLLAETMDKEKDYEGARAEYAKVKSAHPSVLNWAILSDYAIALSYYNEWLEDRDTIKQRLAENSLNKYITTYATDKRIPNALMTRANLHFILKNYEDAMSSLDMLVNFNSNQMTNVASGHMENELVAHMKLKTDGKLFKANILNYNLKQFENAISAYNEVLSVEDLNEIALLGKAKAMISNNSKDKAIPVLNKIINNNLSNKLIAQRLLSKID